MSAAAESPGDLSARPTITGSRRTTVIRLCSKLKGGMSVVRDFVERREEGFYVATSRVPLACVVREFQNGQSPEAIRGAFPTLSLEQVYGAITFYLGHKDEVDDDIAARERTEDAFSKTHSARLS
jgi:uncharacterized protein (DUF433 family)